jgi:hypothetical protein
VAAASDLHRWAENQMKRYLVLLALVSCIVAQAGDKKAEQLFRESLPAEFSRFSMVNAQALADAQRVAMYGACGMCVFKDRVGPFWILEAKAGFGGIPKPDIIVVDPSALSVPRVTPVKMPNQSSQPTPGS